MSAVTCPTCHVVVPSQEVRDGWCENCGKKLSPFALTRSAASGRKEPPADNAAAQPKKAASKAELIVAALLGGLVFGLLLTGPLRSTGYLITWCAGFGVLLAAFGVVRAVGSLFHDRV